MAFWQSVRRFFFAETIPDPVNRAIRYATSDQVLLGHIGRADALSIHGVMRARDTICGLATLPLVTKNARNDLVDNRLLRQFDPSRTNVKTLSLTFEDLFFNEIAWWHVTERENGDPEGYPTYIEHVELGRVTEAEEGGQLVRRLDGKRVPAQDLILFESPKAGLLTYGGRLLRRALNLDKTAAMYADNPRPLDYFTPIDQENAMDAEEAEEQIRAWRAARKVSATAYIKGLEYHEVETPTPQQLELVAQQKQASIEIANMTGLDTEDLGVSTTSRTYQNAVDRRKDRINDLLALFLEAVEQRLSMGDITRNGHRVEFFLDDYLKADPKTRAEVELAYLAAGVTTVAEIRKEEGKPDLTTEQMLQVEGRRVLQATIQQPRQIGAGNGGS